MSYVAPAQEQMAYSGWRGRSTWLQSRRMHERVGQQAVITEVFDAAQEAVERLTHLIPDLARDRTEYALASALLEEAWVNGI